MAKSKLHVLRANFRFRLIAAFTPTPDERQLNDTKQTRSPGGRLFAQLSGSRQLPCHAMFTQQREAGRFLTLWSETERSEDQ